MDDLGEVIHKYAALSHQPDDGAPRGPCYLGHPGQGPGEDGEEGTGPTPEQIREMHEEHRRALLDEAQEIIRSHFVDWVPRLHLDKLTHRCVEALRKEGLL